VSADQHTAFGSAHFGCIVANGRMVFDGLADNRRPAGHARRIRRSRPPRLGLGRSDRSWVRSDLRVRRPRLGLHTPTVRGSLALGIAVVTGARIAGLVVTEIGLRVAGFAHASLYARDERRGWALRPGVTAWVGTEAGRRLVRTTTAGLRDREPTVEKPPGTVRIAVLGDSFTEALQVAAEETFWAVLERALQSCPAYAGRAVEVINFGVGGYGTAQELLTWREQASRYAPDLSCWPSIQRTMS